MAELRQPMWVNAEDVPPLPDGWRALPTAEACVQLKPGKLFDSRTVSEIGSVPVLNQSENGFLGYHDEQPGVVASLEAPVVTFANHTCAMRLMKQPFSSIQNIFPKVGKPGVTETIYFYYASLGRVGLSDYKGHHPVFRQAHIPIPPLPIQRRIADILSAYDELIDNCQRRIEILEQMARALYREWFVKFRYPGHESVPLVSSPLGEIPQGWEMRLVKEAANVIYGFPFASKGFNANGVGVPVIRIRDILAGESSTFTSEIAEQKYHVKNGDILVGMDGDFHMCIWSGGHALQNQRVARFESKGEIENLHLFLALEQPVGLLNRSIVGTTVAHLGDNHIRSLRIPWAPASVRGAARNFLEPMGEEIVLLRRKSRNLRRTRDLLLPRLISGQLDVDAA
jgi:restriction endonuclease S subunit